MNLTNEEYEAIIESITISLNSFRRKLGMIENAHKDLLEELKCLRVENEKLRRAASAAELSR